MCNPKPYPPRDLDEICLLSKVFLDKFSNAEILIAGATGFIGSWIISTLNHANNYYHTNIKITGLSRSIPSNLRECFPEINLIQTDITQPNQITELNPDCIFNAATPSTPQHGGGDALQVLNVASIGTKNLIELVNSNKKATFLNLSSGIVTKRQESQTLDLNNIKDAYLEGKRISEKLVQENTSKGLLDGKNLRLYAFAGPGISLTDHFAVGNFMNDAKHGRPIAINGNPSTRRSYLYPTDLISNIFVKGISEDVASLEIGSSTSVTMLELARLINSVYGNEGIELPKKFGEIDEYFPTNAGVSINQEVSLTESIDRWKFWLSNS